MYVTHIAHITDMELLSLMPWAEIYDGNGFPYGEAKKARFVAAVSGGRGGKAHVGAAVGDAT